MSKINRNHLRKLILKEFKMIGMGNMGTIGSAPLGMPKSDCSDCGSSPCGCDEYDDHSEDHDHGMKIMSVSHGRGQGTVSREDCCEAVKCLIECCSCPITKQALMECCEDILSGAYDK